MRKPWNEYFMDHAELASTMATCDRKHVGAIAVKDKRILATGFNGAPSCLAHCTEAGHDIVLVNGRESCSRAVHAEINIVTQAAKFGISIKDSVIYVNTYPCYNCFKTLSASGISSLYYKDNYQNSQNEQTEILSSVLHIPIIKL